MKNKQHSNLIKRFNDNRLIINYLEDLKKENIIEPKSKLNRYIKELSRKQYKIKEQIKQTQHKYSLKHK